MTETQTCLAVLDTASLDCADNVSKEQGDCGTSPQ